MGYRVSYISDWRFKREVGWAWEDIIYILIVQHEINDWASENGFGRGIRSLRGNNGLVLFLLPKVSGPHPHNYH